MRYPIRSLETNFKSPFLSFKESCLEIHLHIYVYILETKSLGEWREYMAREFAWQVYNWRLSIWQVHICKCVRSMSRYFEKSIWNVLPNTLPLIRICFCTVISTKLDCRQFNKVYKVIAIVKKYTHIHTKLSYNKRRDTELIFLRICKNG